MKKDFGSITERKDGRLYGRVQYKGLKKEVYGTDRKQIQDTLNDFVMTVKYNNLTLQNTVLFSDYCMKYLYTYKYPQVKRSSFDRLENICQCHIVGSCIDIPIYQLDDMVLQRFLVDKAKIFSKSTVKKIYDLLKMVLFYAYRKKDVEVDIGSFLSIPKVEKEVKPIEAYTDDEMNVLISGIEDKVKSKEYKDKIRYRYAFAYLILYHTGMRASELLALTKDKIDLDKRKIYVDRSLVHVKKRDDDVEETSYIDFVDVPKTSYSVREIPINEKCFEYIMYLEMDDIQSVYLVHNLKGEYMKLRSFQQTFKRICLDIGVQYRGLHALRHTFASVLIARGVNVNVVSKLLGHSSVRFTYDRYVHPYSCDYKEAVKALE